MATASIWKKVQKVLNNAKGGILFMTGQIQLGTLPHHNTYIVKVGYMAPKMQGIYTHPPIIIIHYISIIIQI